MTDGYHCVVEFYLPGQGWIPPDPSDVKKLMLVENSDLKQTTHYIDYYFSAVDENRTIFKTGGRNIDWAPM